MKKNSSHEVTMFSLEEEYKKGTGIKPADIEKLREWLKTQAHLPLDYITDLDLILAYHRCGRSTEVTKQVLDLNLTLRTLFTDLFQNRVFDEKVVRTLNTVIIKPLPTRSRDGYACLYAYFNDKDPKNFVVLDILKTALMIIDMWQFEEGTWPGCIIVADLQNIGLSHLMCLDYINLQHFFYFVQEAIWTNTKAIHFINVPPFMDKIMSMLKPMVKNFDVFTTHSRGSSSIDTVIPLEALPKDVGGDYLSLEECKAETMAKLKTNSAFFEAESLKRVCESRRPGKPKTVADFFGGVEGSFKKLDID